ncbi:MAG: O-antigen ligase family protein [Candidatus Acidiferrales bacterium]
MKALDVQTPLSFPFPITRIGYGVGILVVIFVSVITGISWQAGLTLTLVFAYIVLISVRLEWGIYAIVAFAILCIDGWTPNRSPDDVVFRLAIGRIYIMEFAVYVLLAAYLIRRAFSRLPVSERHVFVPTPLDLPLKLFAGLLPAFAFYGFALGNPAQDAFGYYEWRVLFMAIVFYFLITTIIGTREKALKLFWWFLALDTIIGLYCLTLYVLGSDGPLPFVLGTGPVGEGPENYMFVFAALGAISCLFFCREKNPGKRSLVRLAAIVPVVNILFSEKRSAQLGLLVGLVVLAWRVPFRKKLKWGAVIAGLALIALLFASATGLNEKSIGLGKSASRYTEITQFLENRSHVADMSGETLLFHIFDFVDSFNSIRLRPILGYGFGGEFVRKYTALAFVGGENIEPGIVHDQYLHFWLKMGLGGLLALLWIYIRFFKFCRSAIPRIPVTEFHAVALGLCAAMWGDLAIETWGPVWIGDTKIPLLLFLSLALVVCVSRKERAWGVPK